jgi:hypothetical protein
MLDLESFDVRVVYVVVDEIGLVDTFFGIACSFESNICGEDCVGKG